MYHSDYIIILCVIIVFALLSRRISASLLSLPMVFMGAGMALDALSHDLVPMDIEHELTRTIAEITLIIVLFADASVIKLSSLKRNFAIPARMLLIGMPLTILTGTLLARWASPELAWSTALLVAAILTPTDAALGQAVVSSPSVPQRIREGINVESGLNDGLAVPIILAAALMSVAATGTSVAHAPDNLWLFAALQLTLGPLVGIAMGWGFARLLDLAIERATITVVHQGILFLAVAFLIYLAAEAAGGNGFIAVFLGGLTFGNQLRHDATFIEEFMESEGQLLTMATFLIFGAVMVPLALEFASWKTLVLALLYLTVIRMLPIWLSLSGLGLSAWEKIFLGWFGPRGLASILFALLIYSDYPIPGSDDILASVVLTVMISVVLHGISAQPMARWFGRRKKP
ncbi:sodium:proton antiporter [Halomonas cupida]|uniref:Sodium/proton antiporter, CPA1 family (TC 2.A.36) n=1 Tax=Halomonas cupida TaxID=44933 RepID=A0A1M7HDJ6_9GAMM|nr:sodium:proton antiporter [Halomonas cupida]GEN25515.1 sodium:proton antiporter [Halomonas cupida]SHM26237.1 sodium/proton antiporter, CPA1 family (TC 2.A.36) [Halomonas cupida]